MGGLTNPPGALGGGTVSGALEITGNLTLSSMTEGSVLFAGSGGVVSEDNANLFWDDSNNRLGVGTATPADEVEIVGAGSVLRLTDDSASGTTAQSYVEFYDSASRVGWFGNASGSDNTIDLWSSAANGIFRVGTGGATLGNLRFWINAAGNAAFGVPAGSAIASKVEIRAAPGTLSLTTQDTAITDGDKLGQINFIAPVEAAGSVSRAVGASIWAEADATFSTTVNDTDLVFATGKAAAATEKIRLDSDGNWLIGTTAAGTSAAKVLGIANGTQGAAKADMVQLASEDLSAGNTILSIRTEGTGAVVTGTPAAANGGIAIKVNGTVRYLTYSDTAPT